MIEPPESVRHLFIAAGWHPNRYVELSHLVPADHPAHEILTAFTGLVVSQPDDAEGEECGLDDLAFEYFRHNDPGITEWAARLDTHLVGIAEILFRHGQWYIATDGRVFGGTYLDDGFWLAGLSFAEAVERSLFGRRVRPLLRPNQTTTKCYGELFTAESPEVYRYTEFSRTKRST